MVRCFTALRLFCMTGALAIPKLVFLYATDIQNGNVIQRKDAGRPKNLF
jgi:hypothetical protein